MTLNRRTILKRAGAALTIGASAGVFAAPASAAATCPDAFVRVSADRNPDVDRNDDGWICQRRFNGNDVFVDNVVP